MVRVPELLAVYFLFFSVPVTGNGIFVRTFFPSHRKAMANFQIAGIAGDGVLPKTETVKVRYRFRKVLL